MSNIRSLLRWSVACSMLANGLLLSGCASTSSVQQTNDQLPMYGQPAIERSGDLKRADEEFIKQSTEPVGTREVASKVLHSQGNVYMNRGNVEFAMRRYNQSWLLNPNNYQPYWGFGRVALQRGKFDEAIGYFEKAKEMCDDKYQMVALLSDTGTAYAFKAEKTDRGNVAERTRLYALAYDHYKQSVAMDPKYPNAWRNWAWTLHLEGKNADAGEKIKEARSVPGNKFPPDFLRDLEQKLQESK
jgi:tetratricopeptide (TPR) repeat protein